MEKLYNASCHPDRTSAHHHKFSVCAFRDCVFFHFDKNRQPKRMGFYGHLRITGETYKCYTVINNGYIFDMMLKVNEQYTTKGGKKFEFTQAEYNKYEGEKQWQTPRTTNRGINALSS